MLILVKYRSFKNFNTFLLWQFQRKRPRKQSLPEDIRLTLQNNKKRLWTKLQLQIVLNVKRKN